MSCPAIERLPAEMRLLFMSFLEIDDLLSLRAASPAFCQTYFANRKSVLVTSLSLILGLAVVDARYTYTCRQTDFLHHRSPEGLYSFMDEYSRSLSARAEGTGSDEDVTEEAAVEMSNFHRNTIAPLLSRIIEAFHMLRPYEHLQCSKALEAGEKVRLFRAMYRWEILCHLFSGGHLGLTETIQGVRDDPLLPYFCKNFHSWETEEIRTIYVMVRVLWTPLRDPVCSALNQHKLHHLDSFLAARRLGISRSVAASAKYSCFSRRSSETGAGVFPFCNRLLGRGLSFLQQALEMQRDPKQLVAKLLEADQNCRRRVGVQHWLTSQTYMTDDDPPWIHTPCTARDVPDEEAKRHPRAWCVLYKCSTPEKFPDVRGRYISRYRRMGIPFWGPERLEGDGYERALSKLF